MTIACRHTVPQWHLVTVLTLCPLGQPEKAIGHESQIEPWLTPYNHRACRFQKLNGVLATRMEPLRWNKPSNQVRGAQHLNQASRITNRGWMSRTIFAPPAEGRKCS